MLNSSCDHPCSMCLEKPGTCTSSKQTSLGGDLTVINSHEAPYALTVMQNLKTP